VHKDSVWGLRPRRRPAAGREVRHGRVVRPAARVAYHCVRGGTWKTPRARNPPPQLRSGRCASCATPRRLW